MSYLRERKEMIDSIRAMIKNYEQPKETYSAKMRRAVLTNESQTLDLKDITPDVDLRDILEQILALINLDNEQSSKMNIALQAVNGFVAIACMVIAVLVKLGVL